MRMSPIIANGRVRGALPALGQPKTPATIPHSDRLGKEFRHRSVRAAGRPACTQVSRCTGLSGSDREFPALTGRSGTQRARRVRSRSTRSPSAALVPVITAAPMPVRGPHYCPAQTLPRTRLPLVLTADGFCPGSA